MLGVRLTSLCQGTHEIVYNNENLIQYWSSELPSRQEHFLPTEQQLASQEGIPCMEFIKLVIGHVSINTSKKQMTVDVIIFTLYKYIQICSHHCVKLTSL
jgi:hypothetical protein